MRLMTDGLLLAEIRRDRLLRRYDTIIVDEAHERSLNVDFLLGYLARILPRRPDLKVIITSATIDPRALRRHFGGAPVVEVSGRTYPVEVRYRPPTSPRTSRPDQPTRSATRSRSCCASARRRARVPLRRARDPRHRRGAARAAAQTTSRSCRCTRGCRPPSSSACSSRTGGRRVVLATNVAETSLTVPGIRYVVDPGTARISRYSARLKVQRLPIEPISQASADQRKGRCGRTSDGVCDPPLLRGGLRGAPALHRPGDPAHQPRRGDPADGGARARRHRGLPVPGPARPPPGPRRRRGCCRSSARSTTARRLTRAGPPARAAAGRPAAGADGARGGRARLRRGGDRDRRRAVDPGPARAPARAARAGRPAARALRRRALGLPRLPEPVALPARAAARAVGQPVPQALQGGVPALPARARVAGPGRAAAAGRPRSVGVTLNQAPGRARRGPPRRCWPGCSRTSASRTPPGREYLGARGARFAIFPGSALARKPPAWVMAAELVETSRLWGRDAARIDPSGSSRWPSTWSRAPTASRAGSASAPRSWPPSG